MNPNGDYPVLTAMLAPALFMTATGSLLLSANNRLARVVDRLRTLADLSEKLAHGPEQTGREAVRLAHVRGMIRLQKLRSDVILTSVTLLYSAFAGFVGSSLAIALNHLTEQHLAAIPTGLAVVGVALLLAACGGMLREARLGVRALNRDVDFYTRLTADDPPAPPGG